MNQYYQFLFFYLYSVCFCYIKIPFETSYQSNISENNIYSSLITNYIYSNICFGSDKQCFKLNIQLQSPQIAIIGSDFNSPSPKFNSKSSNTYIQGELKNFSQTNTLIAEDETFEINCTSYESIDTIYLEKNKEIKQFNFLVVKENFSPQNFVVNSGVLGFDLRKKSTISEKSFFVYQLKKNDIISSDVFYFSYNDEHTGNVFIGKYPHEISSEFKQKNLIETYTHKLGGEVMWGLEFENIKYNGSDVDYGEKIGIFSIEIGVIVGPSHLNKLYNNTFFKQYIEQGLCREEYSTYESYSCDDSSKIQFDLLQPLQFYHKDLNKTFVFTYEDLFYTFQGRKYFLLSFCIGDLFDTYWFLGKPFFKKYAIYFKPDSKRIGTYKDIESKGSFGYWFIFAGTSSLIIGFLVYFALFVFVKPRKKRAIELDDDYDYIPKA